MAIQNYNANCFSIMNKRWVTHYCVLQYCCEISKSTLIDGIDAHLD